MKNPYEISFDDNNIERRENSFRFFWLWSILTGGSGYKSQTIGWTQIKAAYVYKRDAFTVDLICLAFRLEDDSMFELNESMQGWDYLIENLPEYLPNCKKSSEWFMEVAFPAFEMNLIEIYSTESSI